MRVMPTAATPATVHKSICIILVGHATRNETAMPAYVAVAKFGFDVATTRHGRCSRW